MLDLGFTRCRDLNDPKAGAFAEYCIVQEHIPFKVPDNISDEEAATLSVSISTVVGRPLPGHLSR